MQAVAAFPKTREVKLVDHPEPRLTAPTQAKLKMKAVGVCGTDREIWGFEYGAPPPGSDYLITGHESLAEVVEVGEKAEGVKVGDLVVATVRRGCTENCASCANMKPDFCFTGNFTERGIKGAHGFMTEYAVEDARYLNVVPRELAGIGMLLEPLTITEKALLQTFLIQSRLPWECRIEPGVTDKSCRNAVVLGAGPVGMLAAMAFRLLNMKTFVVARDPGPSERTKLCEAIGARYFSTKKLTAEQIAAEVGNVDLVFEATGAAGVSFDFLKVLGTNGIFIFTGVPGLHKDLTLDAGALMRSIVLKNQAVLGTVNAPKEAFERGVRDLLEMKKRWPKELAGLITERYKIGDLPTILKEKGEMKTVIEF